MPKPSAGKKVAPIRPVRATTSAPYTLRQSIDFVSIAVKAPINRLAQPSIVNSPPDDRDRMRQDSWLSEFASAQWEAMLQHPCGQALQRSGEFEELLKLFDDAQGKASRDLTKTRLSKFQRQQVEKLLAYNARLRFMQKMVLFGQSAWNEDWKKKPRVATAEQLTSTLKHAKGTLHGLRSAGISLEEYTDHYQLLRLLDQLVTELGSKMDSGQRKKRTDDNAGARALLGGLAYGLLRDVGWCRPAVLVHFMRMTGMPSERYGEKLAQRLCNEQRDRLKRLVESTHPSLDDLFVGQVRAVPDRNPARTG